uniref:Uncharacterized protein n=1 Tax=Bracon brevicornis TaxID=1563983 RepID=A0A6V7L8X2_9HYME
MENNRRTRRLHRIEWFEGHCPAEEVYQLIMKMTGAANIVYTVGEESRLFLERLMCRDVVDMEMYNKWRIEAENSASKTSCVLHALRCHPDENRCSLSQARKIKEFFYPLPPQTEEEVFGFFSLLHWSGGWSIRIGFGLIHSTRPE